jgi:hypothetical protein
LKGKPRLPKRIFLSHATRDRRHASRIAKVLREHGIPVWYSRIHLGGAQQWQQEIGKALRQCDWFLVLLSPSAVKSMWVKRELSYALIQKRYENKIIPLVLHDCDHESLHWTLATFQMIDFTKGFASGWTELIRIWAVPSVVPNPVLEERQRRRR